jgi:hypothetical protein
MQNYKTIIKLESNLGGLMKTFVLIMCCLVSLSTLCFAGVDSSGGGNAVVCRDSRQKIVSAEWLDLYEGKAIYKFLLLPNADSAVFQFENAWKKLICRNPQFPFLCHPPAIQGTLEMLPVNVVLEPINDSYQVFIPKGCKIEQTARYVNQDKILVVSEIWAALDEQSRAALMLHESIYAGMRVLGETDSRRSRLAVGAAFSVGTIDTPNDQGEKIKTCVAGKLVLDETGNETPAYTFDVVRLPTNVFQLVFSRIDGHYRFNTSTITLGNWPPLAGLTNKSIERPGIESGDRISINRIGDQIFISGQSLLFNDIIYKKEQIFCN